MGSFVKGIVHGIGKMFFVSGEIYDGDWQNGQRTGRGRFQFEEGEYYEGNFFENKYHGLGLY